VRRAKLRPPAVAREYVRRSRLLELVDAATAGPITLVVAGAGAGKSTLAAGWVAETSVPTAWVSLDSTDRDAGSFWTCVIQALRTFVPGCGTAAIASLRRQDAIADAVGQMLDELDSRDRPVSVLVIDDLQLVDEADEVTGSLGLFVNHLPAWLHVMLLSRRELLLPRDRLRAQGLLGEVRFAELRFSATEAREVLCLLAPTLPDDKVEEAVAHADGWAAGLRLAALAERAAAVAGSADSALDGGDILVHDFVLREVLAAESSELVDFLTSVAVVERVNPSLAGALTDRPDASDYLALAEARGLFVSRLGADGWFEMHSLARSALTAELAGRSPVQLTALHVRAARWYEEVGEVSLALEHLLLAQRPRDALRLLAVEMADLYDRGREATIKRVMAAIAPNVVADDFESMIEFAWCHILIDQRRFADIVDQLTWWADRSPPNPTLAARLLILRSMAVTIRGGWTQGGAFARQALGDFGEASWRDPLGRFGWNMVAREIALTERWDDDSEEVREAALALGRDPRRRLAFEGTHALGASLAGRPLDALRIASGLRRAAQVSENTILRGELTLAEAIAHREVGERAQALASLDLLLSMPAGVTLYCRILGCLELAQMHIAGNDFDSAHQMLTAARALADGEPLAPDMSSWIARVATLLALGSGDMGLAGQLCAAIEDPFWKPISTARLHLVADSRRAAVEVLETAVPRCVRHQVILGLLTARALEDHEESLKCAALVVERASTAGMLQTVAAEGAATLELVERAAWRAPDSWLTGLRRAAATTGPPLGQIRLIEPLTERERDVLRFLPSRLTIREIADELFVSMNTLKFHLKVIYRKLGVSSRAEAAEVARRMAHVPREQAATRTR
jgi:LuxR family maltose regulon positive regulatory protein